MSELTAEARAKRFTEIRRFLSETRIIHESGDGEYEFINYESWIGLVGHAYFLLDEIDRLQATIELMDEGLVY